MCVRIPCPSEEEVTTILGKCYFFFLQTKQSFSNGLTLVMKSDAYLLIASFSSLILLAIHKCIILMSFTR